LTLSSERVHNVSWSCITSNFKYIVIQQSLRNFRISLYQEAGFLHIPFHLPTCSCLKSFYKIRIHFYDFIYLWVCSSNIQSLTTCILLCLSYTFGTEIRIRKTFQICRAYEAFFLYASRPFARYIYFIYRGEKEIGNRNEGNLIRKRRCKIIACNSRVQRYTVCNSKQIGARIFELR
jgi:hypothetical protein